MSDSTNFQSPDSADMDFNDQSDFELSEFLKIDEWLGDDPASMVHGAPANSYFYQSNEVDDSFGSSSNPDGPSGRKYPFRQRISFSLLVIDSMLVFRLPTHVENH